MQGLDQPNPPVDFSKLPPEQQAAAVNILYINTVDYAGKCYKKWDQLVRWINGE